MSDFNFNVRKCYLCGNWVDVFGYMNSFDLYGYPCIPPTSGAVVTMCLKCIDEVNDYKNKLFLDRWEDLESEDIFNA